MTLGELREMIGDLEREYGGDVLEMEVYAEYDYGDHSHTRALTDFHSVMVRTPYETAYSDSGLAIRGEYDDDAGEDARSVVVLVSR